MAWQSEMVTLVRHLVDDVDASTYTDDRIEQAIVVSAQTASIEIDFEQTYTIELDCPTITPDPTDSANKDDPFINLVSLKTACLILSSEIKTEAGKSISVSDGPSTINMGQSNLKAAELRWKYLCGQYEDLKLQYKAGGNLGIAILTPYSPGSDVINSNIRQNIL